MAGSVATADTPSSPAASPVTFTGCRPIDGNATLSLIAPPGTAVLDVTYRNDAPAALAMVRVALLVDGAAIKTIDDAGTFAPGATVHRRFQVSPDLFPLRGTASCAAAVVRYADGTTWTNPAIGATVGEGLVQTPESRIRVEQCLPAKQLVNTTTAKTDPKDKKKVIYTSEAVPRWPMSITFIDKAPVAATRVAFTLLAKDKPLQRFEKEGTFSPGVPIEASFTADPNIFPIRTMHPQCRVDEVEFADGTSWKNPAEPDPSGAAQDPGSKIAVLRCSTAAPPEVRRVTDRDPINGIYVTFRNLAGVAAKEVDFDFTVEGEKFAGQSVTGTFTPNVVILHRLGLAPAPFPLGTALPGCIVTRVVYEDGTSWGPR